MLYYKVLAAKESEAVEATPQDTLGPPLANIRTFDAIVFIFFEAVECVFKQTLIVQERAAPVEKVEEEEGDLSSDPPLNLMGNLSEALNLTTHGNYPTADGPNGSYFQMKNTLNHVVDRIPSGLAIISRAEMETSVISDSDKNLAMLHEAIKTVRSMRMCHTSWYIFFFLSSQSVSIIQMKPYVDFEYAKHNKTPVLLFEMITVKGEQHGKKVSSAIPFVP
ncbi:hypothetical protein MJG53_003405 [Ovis ammon polii x Ovis aries]|uniref:Uncharacterized protein n=1 Tax=Ovis ammon polii x Ovis aries TaxID=2918886 RepID=A0ACB9VH40_9CETA|nr:hypothetical protein MJG53_003405 [Ovis ammon polii x Ovis aries]